MRTKCWRIKMVLGSVKQQTVAFFQSWSPQKKACYHHRTSSMNLKVSQQPLPGTRTSWVTPPQPLQQAVAVWPTLALLTNTLTTCPIAVKSWIYHCCLGMYHSASQIPVSGAMKYSLCINDETNSFPIFLRFDFFLNLLYREGTFSVLPRLLAVLIIRPSSSSSIFDSD